MILDISGGSATNTSNDWMWIYGNLAATVADVGGKDTGVTNLPCWLPPGYKVTATGTRLVAMQGNIGDFAGFLSSEPVLGFVTPSGSNVVLEANLTTGYTKVYTGAAVTAGRTVATAAVAVTNLGVSLINLDDGSYDSINNAASPTVTHITGFTGGGLPNSNSFVSNGGTYFITESDTVFGAEVYKNGAHFAEVTTSLAHQPSKFGISPNGQYITFVDTTANTVEMWKGS